MIIRGLYEEDVKREQKYPYIIITEDNRHSIVKGLDITQIVSTAISKDSWSGWKDYYHIKIPMEFL